MNKFKLISVSLKMDTPVSPFEFLEEVDNYYKHKDCVIYLETYCGNKFICSFYLREIADRVLREKEIVLWKKKYQYVMEETNVVCIHITPPIDGVASEDLTRALRQHGKVLLLEKEEIDEIDVAYIVVICLHKTLPARLSVRRNTCVVIEMKD